MTRIWHVSPPDSPTSVMMRRERSRYSLASSACASLLDWRASAIWPWALLTAARISASCAWEIAPLSTACCMARRWSGVIPGK